ncbi:MAG: IS3 family transposase [Bacteroidales bacterium]
MNYRKTTEFMQNAVAESFFKSLKCELIYGNKLISAYQMELEIFEYIECWYNKCRRHSALSNMTIDEFWNNIKLIDNYKNVA